MLPRWHLHEKSREVCIKARSPPASLTVISQVASHTTVNAQENNPELLNAPAHDAKLQSYFRNLPLYSFPRTVPFVRRRKRAVFKVKHLSDVLTKSCRTLDYDYLGYLLF